MLKKITLVITFILFWMISASPSWSQGSKIFLKAEAGFDGFFKPWRWGPVEIDIENKGPALKGKLWVITQENEGNALEYGREIVLPENSKKHFVIYVHFKEGMKIKAGLDSGGKTLLSQPLKFVPGREDVFGIGLLSDHPGLLSYLNDIKLPVAQNQEWNMKMFYRYSHPYPVKATAPTPDGSFERKIFAFPLTVEDVPPYTQVFLNMDVLLIDDIDPIRLSEEQRRAIVSWVQSGGTLILSGAASTKGWPEYFCPGKYQGPGMVSSLAALKSFGGNEPPGGEAIPVDIYKTEEDSVIAKEGNIPLLLSSNYGNGRVVVLVFDPGEEPFRSWTGTKEFFSSLLAITGAPAGLVMSKYQGNALDYLVDKMPSLNRPLWPLAVGLFVIYLLLVGPLTYLALNKIKKRDLLWVAVPGLSLLIVAIAYFIMFLWQGRDVLINAISTVQMQEGSTSAYAVSTVGIFTPSKKKYELKLAGHPLVEMLYSSYGPPRPEEEISSGITAKGEDSILFFRRTNSEILRRFVIRQSLHLKGGISSNLQPQEEFLTGTITNNFPFDLNDVLVIAGTEFQRVGNLKSGEPVRVKIKPEITQWSTPQGPIPWVSRIYPSPYQPGIANNPPPKTIGPETERRQEIISSVAGYEGENLTFNVGFFGWTDQRMDPLLRPPGKSIVDSLTLIGGPLEIKLPPGKFELPPTFIRGNPTPYQSAGREGAGQYILYGNDVLFNFDFSVKKNVRLEEATLYIPSVKTVGPARFSFQIYNWQKNNWEDLPYSYKKGGNAVFVLNPETQIKKTGRGLHAELKVTTKENREIRFGTPTLGFKGVSGN